MKLKAAAVQMVSGTSVPANLQAARAQLEAAARAGCELAVLPEYFCLMGSHDGDKFAAREVAGDGVLQRFLADSARTLGLWLVGGTLPLEAPDQTRVHNSTLVFAPDGRCVARYDKIHLFRFDNGRESYDESRAIQAGHAPAAFELVARDGSHWRVGLSVCYDLRFPELYRQLGADILVVPSAFTHVTGKAHWETLLRARAIENLAYVIAPAQGGLHENGRRTWGHSMVVDPWGAVMDQREEGAGIVIAQLDRCRLDEVRGQLPALDHRIL